MLLRVRGQGASPENSQATLMHLRGFRLTNTCPPSGDFASAGGRRPLRFPHFHVGIEASLTSIAPETELDWQLHRALWKEIWNMYDIAYDGVRLFPDEAATANALLCGDTIVSDAFDFAALTTRTGQKRAVVVTHYFPERGAHAALLSASRPNDKASCFMTAVVLDVSAIPLAEAAACVAVEIAWAAAFASLHGAFASAARVIVRLPYEWDRVGTAERDSLVQEGLDFIGEHIALLVRDFAPAGSEGPEISVIGRGAAAMQCALAGPCGGAARPVVIFRGDHRPSGDAAGLHKAIASALSVNVRVEAVPLRALLDGAEEQWDTATCRENQVINFCPCCGHCGH